MFVMEKGSSDLLKVEDVETLWDPFEETIQARNQSGEEEQPLRPYSKQQLVFPSGEVLPRCWLDPNFLGDVGDRRTTSSNA